MNRDDIIRMAREACGDPAWDGGVDWVWGEVERFANLVAAAERTKISASVNQIHDWYSRAQLSQCDRCGEVNPAEIHTCTPKYEWQGLTNEEIDWLWGLAFEAKLNNIPRHFARMVEEKLKEKNGG